MAWDYTAPLREMCFVIEHVLDAPASWRACPALAECDRDTLAAVLDEAARFARGVLLPLNAPGDREGCRRDATGRVHTPAGFRAAYRSLVQGGWPALAAAPEHGGQGLPLLLDAAVREMLVACNHGLMMYPDLLHGACETIAAHADEALKARYLPHLISGEWLAAMALTEPQAGSDLGQLRTRAVPQADGSLRLSGQKLFISGADHDLSDNVVHLVLCRLPEAPPGSKGVSLALVPTRLPDGTRNAVHVDGLEHKLGLHGSATCAVRYEAATGWLIGTPHHGLAAMFLMMNSARLHVGLQGLAHQEVATQNALRHAQQRIQGGGRPIIEHAAVRHLLLQNQALLEAQRVLAYRAALALDEAAHHADPARRAAASRRAALLTPVVKACCTQQGFEAASRALQVFGGYGYVQETGVEQCLRDVRITMVYEGTNEIQALDLVQRKLIADGGLAAAEQLAEIAATLAACDSGMADADGAAAATALRQQLAWAEAGLARLQALGRATPAAVPEVADAVMAGFTQLLLAWACAASMLAARRAIAQGHEDANGCAAKVARMRYALQWLLPQAEHHWQQVQAHPAPLPTAAHLSATLKG